MIRRVLLSALLACSVASLSLPAFAQGSCPVIGAAGPPPEAIPGPLPEATWQKRAADLESQLASTDPSKIRTLFVGDSLTEAWEPVLFEHFYGHRAAFNFGDRGDNTQGLLWRLSRIPLGTTLRPQLIVLLIGTNDLWPGANPLNVATGITEVLRQIRTRSPQSRVLLVGLLPRGEMPDDPFRALRLMINALLAQCTDSMVTFADPGGMLLDGAGRLTKDFSYDKLHLTWIGYAILGAGLEPYVKQALGN